MNTVNKIEKQVELKVESLGNIFGLLLNDKESGNVRKYKLSIPDYQRAYEWKSYHVKNLLNDTYSGSIKDLKYLMGTIILHYNNSDGDIKYDIIDGQQRLITLTILLYCLGVTNSPLINSNFSNANSFYYIQNTKNEINAFLKNKTNLQLLSKQWRKV